MGAFVSLAYGFAAYLFFVATFSYAIGFLGNVVVPKAIDTGSPGPLVPSLLVNIALLGMFAVQHSVMARRSFKQWWTRAVPAAVERSTYVLAASLALALLLWQWRPIPEPVIWSIDSEIGARLVEAVFWSGWMLLLVSSFLINHFELFGLRQVLARAEGSELPPPEFRTPFLYRYVRHPLYLGFVLAMWATPEMTAGHLLFAAGGTAYILVGIRFEERDLVAQFGEKYLRYRAQVGMLVPGRKAT